MNIKVNDKLEFNVHAFIVTEAIGVMVSRDFERIDDSLVVRITDGYCFEVGRTRASLSNGEMSFGVDNVIASEVEEIINKIRSKVTIMVHKYLEHARFAEIYAEEREILEEGGE
jgi:DNA gyrase/topoisomerase IV subunit B